MRARRVRFVTVLCAVLFSLSGCSSEGTDPSDFVVGTQIAPTEEAEPTAVPRAVEPAAENDGLFPTVVEVRATRTDGQSWRFDVTLLSEYDSPARYADAWRILDADDNELGIRVLGHDHANEQPFTRSTTVEVPTAITTVYIEGRDQLNGWSGERIKLELAGDISGTTVDHASN